MKTKENKLGLKIKELRISRGLLQSELAKKVDVNPKYIGFIEQGIKTPSIKLSKLLEKVLDADLEYLTQENIIARGFKRWKLDIVTLPLISKICTGQPIIAKQHIESYMPVLKVVAKDGSFLLKVSGDSMEDAGIKNNDIIVVRQQPTAVNGDIVVATGDFMLVHQTNTAVDGDNVVAKYIELNDIHVSCDDDDNNCCVLRRFFKRDGYIELRAENSKIDYPVIKPRSVTILGTVIGRYGGVQKYGKQKKKRRKKRKIKIQDPVDDPLSKIAERL